MTDPLKDDLEWEERTGGGKTPKWPTEPTLESVIAEAIHQRGFESVVVVAVARAVRKLLATRQAGWQKPNGELQEFVPDNSNNVHFPSQGWRPLYALPDKETP